jgi:hypothetical protein
MELNLTYEESKRILELGYDFSSICTKFELKTDTEYRVVYGKITKRNDRTEIESSESIEGDGRIVHLQNRSMFDPLMVSIIPHDALAKCLPDYNFTDAAGRKLSCRWYGILPVCSEAYALNDIHIHHKNAYEAFIWCQEKYPEELRAKFEEVMI